MVFGEWWGLSHALARDKHQGIKDMAIAMRMSQAEGKAWDKFMKS